MLQFLTGHPGRVYTRDQLLDYVWGDETFVQPRTVDVHIRTLRKKLKSQAKHIITVKNYGYRFEADVD